MMTKHDGMLNDFYEVYYITNSYRPGRTYVFIGNGGHISDHIELDPSDALSLLTWLEQEHDNLVQFVKEEEKEIVDE